MERFDAKERFEETDRVFSALAHASRRHILLVVMMRGGKMTAGEIAARFGCSWPTTSRHLRVLEKAGLITFKKEGRTRVYAIDHEKLDRIREWLVWFKPPESEG